jgi:citrate lyase subunit beta-like protein
MDCEDGVAFNRKQEAREKIRQLYDNDERLANDSEAKYAVRINSPSSNLASDDINALFTVKNDAQNKASLLPKRVFIPKTSNSEEIKWLFDKFHSVLKSYNNFKSINMFFYMETALSLINLNDIIKTAIHLSNEKYTKKFLLEGFVFGSDDYTADIAAIRTKEANELVYARQKLVAFCKAYKLKVIDMVYIDFKGYLI